MSGVYHPNPNDTERGYFGTNTSPINWCEVDYERTYYFAEFFNTLTNLSFNFTGVMCYQKYKKYNLGKMFLFLCFHLHLLGLTSGLFHASLWLSGQKLDEIFMNYVCITALYIFDTNYESKNVRISSYISDQIRADPKGQENKASSCPSAPPRDNSFYYYLLHCFVCAYFILAIEAHFAEIHMGVVIVVAIIRYIGFFKNLDSDLRICQNLKEIHDIRNQMMTNLWHFIGLFVLAYLGWNIENQFCDHIREWPINPQLHSWWHILCGVSVNSVINLATVYLLYLRKVHMDFLKNDSFSKLFVKSSPTSNEYCLSSYGKKKLAKLLEKEIPKMQFKALGLWSSINFDDKGMQKISKDLKTK